MPNQEDKDYTVITNDFVGLYGSCRHYEQNYTHIERKGNQTLRQAMEENDVWKNAIFVFPGHLKSQDF